MSVERLDKMFARLAVDEEALEIESAEATFITADDVYYDMVEQPNKYRIWALLTQLAELRYKKMEAEFKRVTSDCKQRIRKELDNRQKKTTEDLIKELSILDALYQQSQAQYFHAEAIFNKFSKVEKAMEQRRYMLQSINARQTKDLMLDDYKSVSSEDYESVKERFRQSRNASEE